MVIRPREVQAVKYPHTKSSVKVLHTVIEPRDPSIVHETAESMGEPGARKYENLATGICGQE
jgi:hypothetical protein